MVQRSPWRKPFNATWTPELAWVVGIIATDGNLSPDGRHLTIVSKDRQLLEAVQRCLGTAAKIGRRAGAFSHGEKIYCHLQIGWVRCYEWLQSIGLTPRKSKTLGPIAVPDAYFWDFLRGCFDGDGSCYSYYDPRWPRSYLFYWELCSASPHFLRWIRARIAGLVGLRGAIAPSHREEILKYAKREATVLFEKMYANRKAPCLFRKRDKVDQIMRTCCNPVARHG